jgi:hypothetical protein
MNKAELDYKNTLALIALFYVSMFFADALLVSKLRHSGSFLRVPTKVWSTLHTLTGTAFSSLVLAHMAYRKDKIALIKKYFMPNAPQMPHIPKMR